MGNDGGGPGGTAGSRIVATVVVVVVTASADIVHSGLSNDIIKMQVVGNEMNIYLAKLFTVCFRYIVRVRCVVCLQRFSFICSFVHFEVISMPSFSCTRVDF